MGEKIEIFSAALFHKRAGLIEVFLCDVHRAYWPANGLTKEGKFLYYLDSRTCDGLSMEY